MDLDAADFKILLSNFSGMIYQFELGDCRPVFISDGCYQITGYTKDSFLDKDGILYHDLISEEYAEYVNKSVTTALSLKQGYEIEYQIRHAQGHLVWVRGHGVPIFDADGKLRGIQGYIQDISKFKASEKLLRETEVRYRSIFENSIDGIFQTSPQGQYIAVNQALAEVYGYPNPESLMQGLQDIKDQLYVDQNRRQQFVDEMDKHGVVKDFESQVYRKDKSIIWISENSRKVYDNLGNFIYYEGVVRDVTEHKRVEVEIEYQANHDSLTQLPNRYFFNQKLHQGIEYCQKTHAKLGVVFVGIDHFKRINESMGLEIGDQLLIKIADRVSQSIRQIDFIARLSGDEFAILLANLDHIDDMRYLDDFEVNVQRIMSVFSKPFVINELDYLVSCSVGVSVYPHHGSNASQLLKRAGIALQEAKKVGRKTYKIYNQLLGKALDDRLKMEYKLGLAVEGNEFLLHYQPKVSFATNEVIGAEALIRWQPKDGPMIPPFAFIEIAEQSGLIVAIGGWVLKEACRKNQEWNTQFGINRSIAVNVSHVQFRQEGFLASVQTALQETGLPPSLLELEITESLASDDVLSFIEKLHELKNLGVTLAIDDFGTGYSSMAYLKDFPIDSLKIDQAFVRKLETEPANAAILKAIVVLGQSLEMTVVAEGVETEYQKTHLKALGCDLYQGYLFSKPVSVQAYGQLLASDVIN